MQKHASTYVCLCEWSNSEICCICMSCLSLPRPIPQLGCSRPRFITYSTPRRSLLHSDFVHSGMDLDLRISPADLESVLAQASIGRHSFQYGGCWFSAADPAEGQAALQREVLVVGVLQVGSKTISHTVHLLEKYVRRVYVCVSVCVWGGVWVSGCV